MVQGMYSAPKIKWLSVMKGDWYPLVQQSLISPLDTYYLAVLSGAAALSAVAAPTDWNACPCRMVMMVLSDSQAALM